MAALSIQVVRRSTTIPRVRVVHVTDSFFVRLSHGPGLASEVLWIAGRCHSGSTSSLIPSRSPQAAGQFSPRVMFLARTDVK